MLTGFLLSAGKNILGYVAGKLLKPETSVELLLDLGDIVAKRTDTQLDDEAMKTVRRSLGHEES